MSNKIIEKLGSRASVIKLDTRYKDIGDMPDEEIQKIPSSFDRQIMEILG
jgi:hypothetical protein